MPVPARLCLHRREPETREGEPKQEDKELAFFLVVPNFEVQDFYGEGEVNPNKNSTLGSPVGNPPTIPFAHQTTPWMADRPGQTPAWGV